MKVVLTYEMTQSFQKRRGWAENIKTYQGQSSAQILARGTYKEGGIDLPISQESPKRKRAGAQFILSTNAYVNHGLLLAVLIWNPSIVCAAS